MTHEKLVVVTGCSGQLGSAACQHLSSLGNKVIGLDINAPLDQASLSANNAKYETAFVCGDITSEKSISKCLAEIKTNFGSPNALVHLAAIDAPPGCQADSNGPIEEVDIEHFRRVVDVNLTGAFITAKVFGSEMASMKVGNIIFAGSIYGAVAPRQEIYQYRRKRGDNFYKPAAYGATKAALENLGKYFATYWASEGVRANTLVMSGVFNHQDEEFINEYLHNVPLKRMASAIDVSNAICFLLSDKSSYMTGSSLVVDGGYTAW